MGETDVLKYAHVTGAAKAMDANVNKRTILMSLVGLFSPEPSDLYTFVLWFSLRGFFSLKPSRVVFLGVFDNIAQSTDQGRYARILSETPYDAAPTVLAAVLLQHHRTVVWKVRPGTIKLACLCLQHPRRENSVRSVPSSIDLGTNKRILKRLKLSNERQAGTLRV